MINKVTIEDENGDQATWEDFAEDYDDEGFLATEEGVQSAIAAFINAGAQPEHVAEAVKTGIQRKLGEE